MNNDLFFELYCAFYDFTPAIEEALRDSVQNKTKDTQTANSVGEDSEHK